MARAKTRHPGKTAAQRAALDVIGSGHAAPPMTRRTRDGLLSAGLIVPVGTKVIGRDAFGMVTLTEYALPTHVHIAWCKAVAAAEPEDPA